MKPIKANLLIGFGLILLFGSLFSGVDCAFSQQQFIRGDADGDCLVGVNDINLLICYLYQYSGTVPSCADAADANDNGILEAGDIVKLINYIYKNMAPPPPPFPNPGSDPTTDTLGCATACVSPSASSVANIIIPPVHASAGEVFTVPITVVNDQSLMGYQLYMEFDSTILRFVGVDGTGTISDSSTVDWFSFSGGGNRVDISCTIDCSHSGGIPAGSYLLIKVLFEVKESSPCTTTILDLKNITGPPFWGNLLDYNSGKVYPTLVDGIITVESLPPNILSVTDVGNDQGRQVRLNWNRSCYDGSGSPVTITEYGIWRRIGEDKDGNLIETTPLFDESMLRGTGMYPPGDWDFIMTVPARGEDEYNAVCPTLGDSTQAGGIYWSVFFVSAMTSNPLVYFDSDPDSGYSLDNIPPLPIDLEVNPNSWFTLEWTVPGEYPEEYPISNYDIRYNTVPVGVDTQAWWNSAIACSGTGFFNYVVGETDSLKVAKDCGCHPNVYFAIKGLDDRPNTSPISNFYHFICGDANNSGVVEVGDIMILINYLYRGGSPPQPMAKGDANCNEVVEVGDVLLLINYLFRSGPSPCGS